jgi:hypothetical protein
MTVAEERARRAFDKIQENEGRGVYEFLLKEFEAGFKPDLRDHFAGQASEEDIHSFLAQWRVAPTPRNRAMARYSFADIMIAERTKED